MFMDLFFFWSILSLLVLVYVIVFRSAALDVAAPLIPEPQSKVEPTIIVTRKAGTGAGKAA